MSSGRGRSPCDTGPRELRLDVICPGTLAAASRRTTGQVGDLARHIVPSLVGRTPTRRIPGWGLGHEAQAPAFLEATQLHTKPFDLGVKRCDDASGELGLEARCGGLHGDAGDERGREPRVIGVGQRPLDGDDRPGAGAVVPRFS
jgi:hypothetical protein